MGLCARKKQLAVDAGQPYLAAILEAVWHYLSSLVANNTTWQRCMSLNKGG